MKKFYVKIKRMKYDSLSEEYSLDFVKEAVIEFDSDDISAVCGIRARIKDYFVLGRNEENFSIEIFTKL